VKALTTAALIGVIALGSVTVGCQKEKRNREQLQGAITMNEVPQKVRDAFRTKYPNASVQEIEREVYKDGNVHYEFVFVGQDGKKKEVEFDTLGNELGEH
jgi:uncharacterized membrane protein YkoI